MFAVPNELRIPTDLRSILFNTSMLVICIALSDRLL